MIYINNCLNFHLNIKMNVEEKMLVIYILKIKKLYNLFVLV